MVSPTEGVGRAGDPQPALSPGGPVAARATAPFADVLRGRMDPISGVAEVRSAIAAIRDGSAWAPPASSAPPLPAAPPLSTSPASVSSTAPAKASSGGARLSAPGVAIRTNGGADPNGWRALTRQYGDSMVAPGFGAIFERQIDQESGFDPGVVLGLRRSSAGAEGIAQLMPQYYPDVDRTDPDASLRAGAQTMRDNLTALGGDVRKALAAYNAGLGTVQQLVRTYGDQWERALPGETQQYLASILGKEAPRVSPTTPAVMTPAVTTPAVLGDGNALRLLLGANSE